MWYVQGAHSLIHTNTPTHTHTQTHTQKHAVGGVAAAQKADEMLEEDDSKVEAAGNFSVKHLQGIRAIATQRCVLVWTDGWMDGCVCISHMLCGVGASRAWRKDGRRTAQ